MAKDSTTRSRESRARKKKREEKAAKAREKYHRDKMSNNGNQMPDQAPHQMPQHMSMAIVTPVRNQAGDHRRVQSEPRARVRPYLPTPEDFQLYTAEQMQQYRHQLRVNQRYEQGSNARQSLRVQEQGAIVREHGVRVQEQAEMEVNTQDYYREQWQAFQQAETARARRNAQLPQARHARSSSMPPSPSPRATSTSNLFDLTDSPPLRDVFDTTPIPADNDDIENHPPSQQARPNTNPVVPDDDRKPPAICAVADDGRKSPAVDHAPVAFGNLQDIDAPAIDNGENIWNLDDIDAAVRNLGVDDNAEFAAAKDLGFNFDN